MGNGERCRRRSGEDDAQSAPGVVLFAALVASASAFGCASTAPDGAFGDVARTVSERTGHDLRWNRGTAEDREVAAAVERMLREELTVERAVQVALLENRELQATYEELGVAQAELVQAGLLQNPVISAEVRFPPSPQLPLEVDVAQSFVGLLLLPARKRVAAAALEATKHRVTATVLDWTREVATRFFSLQAAEQTTATLRVLAETTQASHRMAMRLHEAGNVTALELDLHRAEHEQAQVELADAEADAEQEREHLNALMGLWGAQTAWTLHPELPRLPAREPETRGLETLAVAARPELLAARQAWAVRAGQLGLVRTAALLPSAEIAGHFEREPDGTTTIGPSLSVPLPIFDQGQAARAAADALLRQAERRYHAGAVSIRAEVRGAHRRMAAARRRAEYQAKILLPLRRNVVARTLRQHNAMQVGIFDLLRAKRDEVEASRELVRAMREYWISRVALQRAVGGRLPAPAARAASAPGEGRDER